MTPSVWGLEVTGNVGAEGHTADVHMTFSDILSDLNAGIMGSAEARRDRFIVLFAGLGAWLEDDVDEGARTIAVPSVSLVNATVEPNKADVDLTLAVLDLEFGWRVLSLPTVSLLGDVPATEEGRSFTLDLHGGGRHRYLRPRPEGAGHAQHRDTYKEK